MEVLENGSFLQFRGLIVKNFENDFPWFFF